MQACLADQFFSFVLCYLDDLLVYSHTFEEHLERLERVLDRLRQHGLKIKPSKCQMFRREVKYLGHKVGGQGVMTDPDKVDVVKSWPTPKNLKELCSFLGFCSFYRRLVRRFSQTARPLHNLVATQTEVLKSKKSIAFAWEPVHQAAFDELKKLCEPPVLGYADYREPFELEVDAS